MNIYCFLAFRHVRVVTVRETRIWICEKAKKKLAIIYNLASRIKRISFRRFIVWKRWLVSLAEVVCEFGLGKLEMI